ncbi:head-tail connector protein [Pelagimonas varians]|uniref:Phage gp6-like head-tail connector protein n=1 Tax=Pelagimonas varians TaxID=696760 RepID=A0A238K4T0_9RHOB|nr:head-tail connector protein [Pelagimonas varians]PYG30360.1 putative phage protein (predicted DNA packaging)/uncharacterized phiE125 gp8 family phage protein [Pelagimonas varians]SMX37855.1 Phage gp6-like head-tail connector protein [Pelagimonas varians]
MVTLEDVKAHCRVLPEDTDFDLELQNALDAAVDHLNSIDVGMTVDPLPPALKHAALMLAAHFFENKEAVTEGQLTVVPLGVSRLIAPYREFNL